MEWTVVGVVGDIKSSLDGGRAPDDLRPENRSVPSGGMQILRAHGAGADCRSAPSVMGIVHGDGSGSAG